MTQTLKKRLGHQFLIIKNRLELERKPKNSHGGLVSDDYLILNRSDTIKRPV